jgi:hypothetical protein
MSQTNEETQTQNAAPQPQLTENEQKERAALQGLLNEAVNYAARHSALTIGRLETHYEGVAEEKVPIQAKFKESSFLVMRDGPAKELRAGTHKVGELVTVAGVDHGKQSDRQHRFACICSIPKASFTAPVMFPDLFDIFAQADRTGEGQARGHLLQQHRTGGAAGEHAVVGQLSGLGPAAAGVPRR